MNSKQPCLYIAAIIAATALITILGVSCFDKFNKKDNVRLGSDDRANFVSLDTAGQTIYYFSSKDSIIKKYELKNKKTTSLINLSDLANVHEIIFAPSYQYAFVKTYNPSKDVTTNWMADLAKGTKQELSNKIGEIAWSPDSQKIAYRQSNWSTNENNFMVTNNFFQTGKKIASIDLDFEGINLGWIDNSQVYYYPLLWENGPTSVYKINIDTLATQTISQNKNYAAVQFYGDKGLTEIFRGNAQNNLIGLIDLNGNLLKKFDKESSIDRSTISDNLLALAQTEKNGDSLYLINILSQDDNALVQSTDKNKYQISKIMINNDKKEIYFVSNSLLYRVPYE